MEKSRKYLTNVIFKIKSLLVRYQCLKVFSDWEKHLLKLAEVKQITDFVEKMKEEITKQQTLRNQVEVVAK